MDCFKVEKESEIHCLFTKIENKYSKVIYFHKYLGFYTCDMPLKARSILGGVLADEMGLGKVFLVFFIQLEINLTLIQTFILKIKDLGNFSMHTN